MTWYNAGTDRALITDALSKIKAIETQETSRILRDGAHQLIYEGTPVKMDRRGPNANIQHAFGQVRENVIRSVVDACTARMIKRRPVPILTPSDADWSVRKKAKTLNSYIKGQLRGNDHDAVRPLYVRDAGMIGTGLVKVYSEDNCLQIKRVPREEILVEEREGRYGEPRSMFQRHQIPKEVLKALFPRSKGEIDKAGAASRFTDYVLGRTASSSDTTMVDVYEGWHLPSSKKSNDGLHVILIEGGVLFKEEWTRTRFPFAMMHWNPPRQGFWGQGIVENLVPLQQQMDQMLRDSLEALYYGAQLKVFLNRASNVNKKHLTGRHPHVIEYEGQPPAFVAGEPVSQQQLQMMDRIKNAMFELEGAPQAFATGQVSVGLNASGVARDAQYDIESERFALAETQLAAMTLDIARLILDESAAMAKRRKDAGESMVVTWNDRDVMKQIDWADMELDDDSYQLTLEASGYLPDTRHGKLSSVNELTQAGVLGKEQAASLFDEPDIQRELSLRAAPYLNARRVGELLGDEDVPMEELAPDPNWDMPMCIRVAKDEYTIAQGNKAPERILSRYRQFLTMAAAEETKNKKAAAELAAPPPGAPPGMPPDMGGAPPPMDPNAMPPEMMAQMGAAA